MKQQRILVSGAGGFLGRRLVPALQQAGYVVVPLVRGPAAAGGVRWDPSAGPLAPDSVDGFDAVVHLAGEPVLGRWTAGKKRRILESRAQRTAVLASALASATHPPRVFLCASGVNFYGDREAEVVDESASSGGGFLAAVCRAWEAASAPLQGISRVVHLRIGVVLDASGGTLRALLPLYRLGLGAVVGDGQGYISWISLPDVVRAIQHLAASDRVAGAVNLVAPHPVTARAFSEELAAAVHRRAKLHIPAWAARLALGEMAAETVLGSVRAVPERLLQDGFRFLHPELRTALTAVLP